MPAYEYNCVNCETSHIKIRGMQEDDPGYRCETCGYQLVRVYSSIGAVFNGPGFYTTDNRKV